MFSSPASSSSSSSSTGSSPIHPSSLVDPSIHSLALMQLIDVKLSRPVIEYVVSNVADTVDYAMGRPTPSHSRGRGLRPANPKFTTFVNNVLTRAEVTTPVVLGALVYIDRARSHLQIALEEWALERVFLGALIVASKYLNDSTLKNVHWALCTGVFGKRDVGRIEREFLDVLDFQLSITEDDLLSHHAGLSAAALTPSHHRSQHFSHPSVSRSHPHTQSRHHHRSHVPVPELEPSSPESSEGSSSPQTPSTTDSSPAATVPSKSGLHDLLRSFPLPIPSHHSQPHHLHGSQHFPIQVDV